MEVAVYEGFGVCGLQRASVAVCEGCCVCELGCARVTVCEGCRVWSVGVALCKILLRLIQVGLKRCTFVWTMFCMIFISSSNFRQKYINFPKKECWETYLSQIIQKKMEKLLVMIFV